MYTLKVILIARGAQDRVFLRNTHPWLRGV